VRGELLTATAYHFAPAEVLVAADEGACADALCTATQCASLSNVKRGAQRGSGVFVAAIVVGFAFGAADQYLGSRSATLGPWVVAVSLASAQRWRSDRSWLSAALVAGALCLEPLARWLTGRLLPPVSVWAVEIAAGVVLALCFVVAGVARERGTA
jgi:hypothetical protein